MYFELPNLIDALRDEQHYLGQHDQAVRKKGENESKSNVGVYFTHHLKRLPLPLEFEIRLFFFKVTLQQRYFESQNERTPFFFSVCV